MESCNNLRTLLFKGVPFDIILSDSVLSFYSGEPPKSAGYYVSDDNELLCRITKNGSQVNNVKYKVEIKDSGYGDEFYVNINGINFKSDSFSGLKLLISDFFSKLNNSITIPSFYKDAVVSCSIVDDSIILEDVSENLFQPIIVKDSSNVLVTNITIPENTLKFIKYDNELLLDSSLYFGDVLKTGVATFFRIHKFYDTNDDHSNILTPRIQGSVGDSLFYDLRINPNFVSSKKITLYNLTVRLLWG